MATKRMTTQVAAWAVNETERKLIMTNQLINFEFDSTTIRTLNKDGKVMFCGKDVAEVLGYRNTNKALNDHCRGVTNRYPITDTLGRTQEARFITEGDLYRLIAGSKLESAQRFEAWIFDEVLPSIRKHGGYVAGQEQMSPEEMVLASLKFLQSKVAEQQARIDQMRPKEIFADAVAASKTSILIGDLAKFLKGNGVNIGANRLFKWMRDQKYLIRRQGSDWNMPTQKSMELGLFEVKETAITHSDGHVTISKTPKVTGKGQEYFINKFLDGQLAVIEQ